MMLRKKSPIWHPFTQHALQAEMVKVVRGDGAYLYTADGRRIIDAIASWWVVTHGHCHPHIVAAMQKQAEKLNQIIFAGHTHEPAEEVAAALMRLAPDGLDYVFFSDSGSTSVEVALKMALGYWRNIGEPRSRIVVMQHSYHGDTIGAMSVGARGVFNAAYGPLLFDVTTIPFPAHGHEQATLDALEAAVRDAKPAAFIVEPLILGAGGMLMYPAWVLKEMKRICEASEVLFIADEVMTGWGRTGTLFACEQADVIAGYRLLLKGPHGWIAAAGGDVVPRRDFRRALFVRPHPHFLSFELIYRQSGRLRRRQGQSRFVAGPGDPFAGRRRRGDAGAGHRAFPCRCAIQECPPDRHDHRAGAGGTR